MGDQAAPRPAETGERDPRFPPMVRFDVFVESVERLNESPPRKGREVLDALSDNDRSQLVRALSLFGLVTEDGTYDELALRRIADPQRRPDALRELLHAHYADELDAISSGIPRDELEDMLAVPGRNSPSSRQKARQFLERAMEAAGMPTDTIVRADRREPGARSASTDEQPGDSPTQTARGRYVAQLQEYLDQLLAQHDRATTGDDARQLRDAIESVSRRLDRFIENP